MYFPIEVLFGNSGYSFIGEEILSNLNVQEIAKSRLVSKSWKVFIDDRKSLIIKQMNILLKAKKSEWKIILKNFAQMENLEDLKEFFCFVRRKHKSGLSPLHLAAWCGQTKLVTKLLKHFPKNINFLNEFDRNGWNLLHRVINDRHVEILTLILNQKY